MKRFLGLEELYGEIPGLGGTNLVVHPGELPGVSKFSIFNQMLKEIGAENSGAEPSPHPGPKNWTLGPYLPRKSFPAVQKSSPEVVRKCVPEMGTGAQWPKVFLERFPGSTVGVF